MKVSIIESNGSYPDDFPFHPSINYPEYDGPITNKSNHVYDAVRRSLKILGYDKNNQEKSEWNPLKHIVKPGDRVFIKPNLVASEYRASCPTQYDLYTTITHPSVIRAVSDYVAIALRGEGEIILGDNPSIDANYNRLFTSTTMNRFPEIYEKIFGTKYRVIDLRPYTCDDLKDYGFRSRMTIKKGDPEGYSVINLGQESSFHGLPSFLFRGIYNKRWATIKHHHGLKQEYGISNSILNADVYISIPKLKTHRKVGATLNLKGLVGINALKDYLIHWRIGYPLMGGDEFPPPPRNRDYVLLFIRHMLNDFLPELFYLWLRERFKNTPLENTFQTEKSPSGRGHRGAWEGNDSCWRMVVDLYKILLEQKKKRTFSVVDGILAGDGDGPFCPTPKHARTIISGEDILAVDCVSTRLMDLDISKIRYLASLLQSQKLQLKDIQVLSEKGSVDDFFSYNRTFLQFIPPKDWNSLVSWRKRLDY